MAELPTTVAELLEFLATPAENLTAQAESIPDDLLIRARSTAAYLEDLLHGRPVDRIVILDSTL